MKDPREHTPHFECVPCSGSMSVVSSICSSHSDSENLQGGVLTSVSLLINLRAEEVDVFVFFFSYNPKLCCIPKVFLKHHLIKQF